MEDVAVVTPCAARGASGRGLRGVRLTPLGLLYRHKGAHRVCSERLPQPPAPPPWPEWAAFPPRYAAQQQLLRRRLDAAGLGAAEALTVDGCQGREKEVRPRLLD